MRPFDSQAVAATFAAYPPQYRQKLMALRAVIFDTAAATEGVGELEETLKWGEPAYLTPHTKSGSTIRIGWKKSAPEQYAIYFHCQTNLVASFRAWFPNDFEFVGNRSIVFRRDDVVPVAQLSRCVAAALTYHLHRDAMLR